MAVLDGVYSGMDAHRHRRGGEELGASGLPIQVCCEEEGEQGIVPTSALL